MEEDRCQGVSVEKGVLRNGEILQGIELFIPFHSLFLTLNSRCLFYGTSICQSCIEAPLLAKREYTTR